MTSPDVTENDAGEMSANNIRAWDELYGETDLPIWGHEPIGFLEKIMDQVGPQFSPQSKVLDAATGEGRNLEMLLRTKSIVHACDASANALAKLDSSLRNKIRCIRCNLMALPFMNDSFAFVLLSDVLETLPHPEAVLDNINRILEPGGLFLCNIPGCDDGISGIDMTQLPDGDYLYKNRYYYRFYDEHQAIELLEKSGFTAISIDTCKWTEPPHPRFRNNPHEHTSRIYLCKKVPG